MNIHPNLKDFLDFGIIPKQLTHSSIFQQGVLYPFSYLVRDSAKKIVFFLPGAFDRENKIMPKFLRDTYFQDLEDCHCFSFFDPTLFQSDRNLKIGWFQGNADNFYIESLAIIIKELVVKLGVKNEDILFFSTSAGGIPAMNLAKEFLGCHMFAGNIQTNALYFYKSQRDFMLSTCYPNKTLEEVEKKYKERVSIDHIDCDFNLYYVQNLCDEFHCQNFFEPYSKIERKHLKVQYVTYRHEASGHNPLPKQVELAAIKQIFAGKPLEDVYKNLP